ncbi:MAG: GlsB/YeaQ/YmgE family stress response membrane protein [Anaerolineales bacterium]|jgi:uncharacterized membrane protein YeaQ/YmgE (transglycosylase-associated protein family)
MQFLIWILSGIIAGWITGLIIKGKGFGLIGDLIIGLLGGLIGGWLASSFGILVIGWLGHVITAAVGGILLVAIVRVLRRA